MALRSIELFAGAGGLALGLDAVGVRSVCYVEREAYAAAVLAARMAEGRLAPAPVWSDVTTFDGRPWRGRVDLVAGGFPCQDVSHAGNGHGVLRGKRSGLWGEFARIISEVAPRLVFIENASALVGRGLDIVLSDLAEMGFDAEWGCFRAADVGAPHRRERIFILAYAHGAGAQGISRAQDGSPSFARAHGPELEAGGFDFPPGPDDLAGWREYLKRHPTAQPAVRRDADGMALRVERLRALGNGVVPAQAALAWHVLHSRLLLSE